MGWGSCPTNSKRRGEYLPPTPIRCSQIARFQRLTRVKPAPLLSQNQTSLSTGARAAGSVIVSRAAERARRNQRTISRLIPAKSGGEYPWRRQRAMAACHSDGVIERGFLVSSLRFGRRMNSNWSLAITYSCMHGGRVCLLRLALVVEELPDGDFQYITPRHIMILLVGPSAGNLTECFYEGAVKTNRTWPSHRFVTLGK
jgi:hypothetical protein